MNRKEGECIYCGRKDPLSIDHVVPLSRWKEFGVKCRVLDNDSNRVLACLKCNGEKGMMSPREWFDLHPDYKSASKTGPGIFRTRSGGSWE